MKDTIMSERISSNADRESEKPSLAHQLKTWLIRLFIKSFRVVLRPTIAAMAVLAFMNYFGPYIFMMMEKYVESFPVLGLLAVTISFILPLLIAQVTCKIELALFRERDNVFETGMTGHVGPGGVVNATKTYSSTSSVMAWATIIQVYLILGLLLPHTQHAPASLIYPLEFPFAPTWPINALFGEIFPNFSPWYDPSASEIISLIIHSSSI
ncbi:hypothetical protein [Thalassobius sp. I31.1]|uniref:hypothetical protein n=1 Tax=Thalassobius sp. I31.1 TaxID=2109912 RepID=UPI001300B394|nr:hypothetical protein [Thalassobius sp. I31.1]